MLMPLVLDSGERSKLQGPTNSLCAIDVLKGLSEMDDIIKTNSICLKESVFDDPIYRIYKLSRFKYLLGKNTDGLVSPTKWYDPFENFFLQSTKVKDSENGSPIPLQNLAVDWYGQCWSFTEESDAMWRIYCPCPKIETGVKVKSTIRKLFENLQKVDSTVPQLQFFVGRVLYFNEQNIKQFMSKTTFLQIASESSGKEFARLLCIKRDAFKHERELRILFQDLDNGAGKRGVEGVFDYQLDPNVVFEEIVLDPRITEQQENVQKAELKNLGSKLQIRKSTLYQSPSFEIPLQ